MNRGRPLASFQNAFEDFLAEAKLPPEVVLYKMCHKFESTLADSRVEAYELMKPQEPEHISPLYPPARCWRQRDIDESDGRNCTDLDREPQSNGQR